ncbi:MAG TPA: peptidoglycan DD-metalloendopeptidase family protein [Nitrospirota bacterium]
MMNSSRIFMVVVALSLLAGAPFAYGGDRNAAQKQYQSIQREMREKKKAIKQADRKARSILSEMEKIDRDIGRGSLELKDRQRQLREAEEALRKVERSNADVSRELARLKEVYGRRVRALYKAGRSGDVAAVLFAPDSRGADKQVKYLGMIAERDRMLMKEYGIALERLSEQQAEIARQKEALLSRQRTVEVKKAELESRKRAKTSLLAEVKGEKELYTETLRELEESSVSLWAMIRRSEQERKGAARPLPPAGAVAASPDKNRLPWPVEGRVITRFGMQRHPEFGTMVYRRGIEIEAREGEPVRAVSDGQVAYADWYKGYGKLIIIDHGAGFYTLYGNLSRLDLKKDDRAARNQVIGLAGDTGSLKGPKLYFEVRRNGQAQDPLAWLSARQGASR